MYYFFLEVYPQNGDQVPDTVYTLYYSSNER